MQTAADFPEWDMRQSEQARSRLLDAVEMRAGPLATPAIEEFFSAVERIRFDAMIVLEVKIDRELNAEQSRRWEKEKQALEAAVHVIQADLDRMEVFLERDDYIKAREILGGMIASRDELINSKLKVPPLYEPLVEARNTALGIVVREGIILWCRMTGERSETLRIGHADHPGPFLLFLEAAMDGLPIPITRHSLHAAARKIVGRR
jgi:hypothetical protein